MSVVGRTYYEKGQPVKVLAQWLGKGCRERAADQLEAADLVRRFAVQSAWAHRNGTAPRNVLIERPDGSLVVRPFRGLRKACHSGPAEQTDDRGEG